MIKGSILARKQDARFTPIPGKMKRESKRKADLTQLLQVAKGLGKAVSFPLPKGIPGHKSAIAVTLYTLFNRDKAVAGHRVKATSRNGRFVAWLVPATAKVKRTRRATRQRSS